VLVLENLRLIPAEDRGSPTTIEFSCSLPANSNTYFTVQFEKAFLHWTEHPPDANRQEEECNMCLINEGVLTLVLR
jgi:hypothetical protein